MMLPLFADSSAADLPLFPHQRKAIVMLKASLTAGNNRIVLQLPTGAGKTRIAAEIVIEARAKGKSVMFVVPAISLIDQTLEAFEAQGVDEVGVIQANHPRTHYGMPVQIASVQTLARGLKVPTDMVIVDECHVSYKVIREWMKREPSKVFIGLSATPWRKGMKDEWQDLVIPERMQALIDLKRLSPYHVLAASHPNLAEVHTKHGDFVQDELASVMSEARLIADVVETWLKEAQWRPTFVFAVDRAHARKLQQQFEAAGVMMGYCDKDIGRVERQIMLDQMAAGKLAGIINVATMTTGIDADVRCIVLARPTKSEMLFVQCVGRGLRTAPGKDHCLVLDHGDNHARLGFAAEIHHDQLCGKKSPEKSIRKKPETIEAKAVECIKCQYLKPPRVHQCLWCGFAPLPQSNIEFEEGELVEVKAKRLGVDKQEFWSMALHLAGGRDKNRKFALSLYRQRFDDWPNGLADVAVCPSIEFVSWEHSRRIAWAKKKPDPTAEPKS